MVRCPCTLDPLPSSFLLIWKSRKPAQQWWRRICHIAGNGRDGKCPDSLCQSVCLTPVSYKALRLNTTFSRGRCVCVCLSVRMSWITLVVLVDCLCDARGSFLCKSVVVHLIRVRNYKNNAVRLIYYLMCYSLLGYSPSSRLLVIMVLLLWGAVCNF